MSNQLNSYLRSIGINIYHKEDEVVNSDFEKVIISALKEADNNKDTKLLSLMLSWANTYADYLIPDKFKKNYEKALIIGEESLYYNIFCIYCFEELKIHKFKKLIREDSIGYLTSKKKDLIAIKIKGEETFAKKYKIHIPVGSLRIRLSDILPVEVLAKENDQLRNRLLIGANWRADIITEIERDNLNAYQISKHLGCSYEPVNRILKQYTLLTA